MLHSATLDSESPTRYDTSHADDRTADHLLEAIPGSLFVFNKHGVCVDAHSNEPQNLWREPRWFIGRNLRECFPGELAPSTRMSGAFTFRYQGDQAARDYEVFVHSTRDSGFSIQMRETTGFQNESQKKQAEQIKTVVASSMEQVGAMAVGVAHEINNPLTIASLAALEIEKMFKGGHFNIERLESLTEKICKSNERISKVIECLLRFSRDESSDPYVRHSVTGVLDDTLLLVRTRLVRKGIQLRTCFDLKDAEVRCRPAQISQALFNVITNAIDAVLMTASRLIEFEAHETDGTVVIKVIDSGPGIPDAIRARLMEPFFTTKVTKVGLGLSVAKDIIEAHGGTIGTEPVERGACFVIRLPAC